MSTTVTNVLSYAENRTQSGAGSINNVSLGVPFLNDAVVDFRKELIKKNIDAGQISEAYSTPTAPPSGQGSVFSFPTDYFMLKTIEINMTDGSQQDYVQAQPLDAANTPNNTSYDWLRVNQDPNNPLFDNRGNVFEIFPSFAYAKNLTNAIKILYFIQPAQYVNLTDVLIYPDTLDTQALSLRVASFYYQSLNKFTEADYWENKYKGRLESIIVTEAQGSKQPLQPNGLVGGSSSDVNGWNL